MEAAKCRSCQAPILWVHSAVTGALMPVDAVPVSEGGNIVIVDDKAHVLKGDLFEELMPLETPKYKSHFATCPNAAKHRKKGKP